MVTTTFPGFRSMVISAIAAWPRRALRYFRRSASSFRRPGKSFALANQLRAPVLGDAEAEADRMSLLSHYRPSFESTTISTWLVRLIIGVARPMAAGVHRLSFGPSFTIAFVT
jgi:hypothetical protein